MFRIEGLGRRVQGIGFRVQDLELRVLTWVVFFFFVSSGMLHFLVWP